MAKKVRDSILDDVVSAAARYDCSADEDDPDRPYQEILPLIERIEADIMTGDLRALATRRSGCRTAHGATRSLAKGYSKAGSGPMRAINVLGLGHHHPVLSSVFAPGWKEEHVLSHLADVHGILQADGYKGYAKLYVPEPGGVPRLHEAFCWAHLGRDFHDFGRRSNPRPPARRSTRSASSMISNATSTVRLQTSAVQRAKR